LLSDGTFIVGQLGAVCQTSTDPFIITLNDAGGQLGVTNNEAYLKKVNAQLQKDLTKCLPPGYNADGAITNLRIVQSYRSGRPYVIEGDMGGAARKNPAALLRCLQKMQVNGEKLLEGTGSTVAGFNFTTGKYECTKENAKYSACDASKKYIARKKPGPAATTTTITTTTGWDDVPYQRKRRTKTRRAGRLAKIPVAEVAVVVLLCAIVGIVLISATVVIIIKTVQWRKTIAAVKSADDDSVFDCKFSDGLGFQYNTRLDAEQLVEEKDDDAGAREHPEIMTF